MCAANYNIMALIKVAQLRLKSEGELKEDLVRVQAEQRKLRFDAAFNTIKNVKAFSQGRKLKARILTLLRERRVL